MSPTELKLLERGVIALEKIASALDGVPPTKKNKYDDASTTQGKRAIASSLEDIVRCLEDVIYGDENNDSSAIPIKITIVD